jgi:hypothetical protein
MIATLARLAGRALAAAVEWDGCAHKTYYTEYARAFISASVALRAALAVAEKRAAEDLPEGDALREEAGR